jgi:hypothetical protein
MLMHCMAASYQNHSLTPHCISRDKVICGTTLNCTAFKHEALETLSSKPETSAQLLQKSVHFHANISDRFAIPKKKRKLSLSVQDEKL